MNLRRHAIIRGRVQGVAFRQHTCQRASGLGVNGWVRNLPDGSVELLAEGEASAVEALLEWCRTGPPAARVDGIDVHGDCIASGEFDGFRITA